jgi:hypothetical protein
MIHDDVYLEHRGPGQNVFTWLVCLEHGTDQHLVVLHFGPIGSAGAAREVYRGSDRARALATFDRRRSEQLRDAFLAAPLPPRFGATRRAYTRPNPADPTTLPALNLIIVGSQDELVERFADPHQIFHWCNGWPRQFYRLDQQGEGSFIDPAHQATGEAALHPFAARRPGPLRESLFEVEVDPKRQAVRPLDLLHYRGNDLADRPLAERLCLLEQAVTELSSSQPWLRLDTLGPSARVTLAANDWSLYPRGLRLLARDLRRTYGQSPWWSSR